MRSVAKLIGAAMALAVTGLAGPALADFSACDAGLRATDPEQQVRAYTLCITQGELPIDGRAGAYNNRGIAYERLKQMDKAFQDFNSAIESDPYWATSYMNRAMIYRSRGDLPKALADFDQAIKVGPASISVDAYNIEAWLLATSRDPAVRDGAKAVRLAQKAVKIKDSWAARDTLAAAYAEVGQFEDAAREQTKAIALADSKHETEHVAEMQARLTLYQMGMPYRR